MAGRELDWDDVRFFLAVARAGTLAGAGRALGVDQTTVGRRITALEDGLAGPLFERTATGFVLTGVGHRVLAAAEAMADAASEVESRAAGADARDTGTVRVATTDTLAEHFVVPAVASLRRAHPGIDVVLMTGWRSVDLLRGEADVAVRLVRPRDPRLVARKVASFALRLYASTSYVRARGAPRGSLEGHDLVAYEDELRTSGSLRSAGASSEGARVVLQTNAGGALLRAVVAGAGIAELPSYVGESRPELVRVLPAHETPYAVWLVVHKDVRRAARVRIVCDAVAAAFGRPKPPK